MLVIVIDDYWSSVSRRTFIGSCCLSCDVYVVIVIFFFKQTTAYDVRISDWSSDVCSSDLATDKAVILGLAGFLPDGIEPELIDSLVDQVRAHHRLRVADRDIAFNPKEDLRFDRMGETPVHPNTLRFAAYDSNDEEVLVQRWCSIGGGFKIGRAHV